MYRLAEIEDIDQIAELRILQQKEIFKDNNSMKLSMFL